MLFRSTNATFTFNDVSETNQKFQCSALIMVPMLGPQHLDPTQTENGSAFYVLGLLEVPDGFNEFILLIVSDDDLRYQKISEFFVACALYWQRNPSTGSGYSSRIRYGHHCEQHPGHWWLICCLCTMTICVS